MRLYSYQQLPHTANIIGIDPGSETLGLSVITVDVTNLQIISTQAQTFTGSKLPYMNEWDSEIHNNRFSRIQSHYQNLLNIFYYYQPIQIASEAPFYNPRMPMAFEVLVEVMNAIRRATHDYSQWRHLYTVPPSNVKNAVKATGGAGKVDVKACLNELRPTLKLINDHEFEMFDEHSIDAIAVAYARYVDLCNSIFHQG